MSQLQKKRVNMLEHSISSPEEVTEPKPAATKQILCKLVLSMVMSAAVLGTMGFLSSCLLITVPAFQAELQASHVQQVHSQTSCTAGSQAMVPLVFNCDRVDALIPNEHHFQAAAISAFHTLMDTQSQPWLTYTLIHLLDCQSVDGWCYPAVRLVADVMWHHHEHLLLLSWCSTAIWVSLLVLGRFPMHYAEQLWRAKHPPVKSTSASNDQMMAMIAQYNHIERLVNSTDTDEALPPLPPPQPTLPTHSNSTPMDSLAAFQAPPYFTFQPYQSQLNSLPEENEEGKQDNPGATTLTAFDDAPVLRSRLAGTNVRSNSQWQRGFSAPSVASEDA